MFRWFKQNNNQYLEIPPVWQLNQTGELWDLQNTAPLLNFENALAHLRDWGHSVKTLYLCGKDLSSWCDGALSLKDLILCARTVGFQKINLISHKFCLDSLQEIEQVLVPFGGRGPCHDQAYQNGSYKGILEHLDDLKQVHSQIYALCPNNLASAQLSALFDLTKQHEALNGLVLAKEFPKKSQKSKAAFLRIC